MMYKRIQRLAEQLGDQSECLTLCCSLSIAYRNSPQIFQAGNKENNWATRADQLDLVPVLALPRAANLLETFVTSSAQPTVPTPGLYLGRAAKPS